MQTVIPKHTPSDNLSNHHSDMANDGLSNVPRESSGDSLPDYEDYSPHSPSGFDPGTYWARDGQTSPDYAPSEPDEMPPPPRPKRRPTPTYDYPVPEREEEPVIKAEPGTSPVFSFALPRFPGPFPTGFVDLTASPAVEAEEEEEEEPNEAEGDAQDAQDPPTAPAQPDQDLVTAPAQTAPAPRPAGLGITMDAFYTNSDGALSNLFFRPGLYGAPIFTQHGGWAPAPVTADEEDDADDEEDDDDGLLYDGDSIDLNEDVQRLLDEIMVEDTAPTPSPLTSRSASAQQGDQQSETQPPPSRRSVRIMTAVVIERSNLDPHLYQTFTEKELDAIKAAHDKNLKKKRGRPAGSSTKRTRTATHPSAPSRRSTRPVAEPATYNLNHLSAVSAGRSTIRKTKSASATATRSTRGRPKKSSTTQRAAPTARASASTANTAVRRSTRQTAASSAPVQSTTAPAPAPAPAPATAPAPARGRGRGRPPGRKSKTSGAQKTTASGTRRGLRSQRGRGKK
ncbi:hypothetical protein ANO11243_040710 [Dothideomycetidae sp. 11243]|nr:hypothetical protein ANO11243_040710 [fungal sp. No.11243]